MPRFHGLGTTRKGRPSISLQTIIDRVHRPKKAAVSVEDAEQAVQVLERSRGRGKRYRDMIATGGVLKPAVRAVGSAVEAGLTAPKGGRFRAMWRGATDAAGKEVKGIRGTNLPRTARDVVEGGLGGAVVNAGREGLELGRARRTAREFLSDKTAAAFEALEPELGGAFKQADLFAGGGGVSLLGVDAKKRGLRRLGQLLSGSRARQLTKAHEAERQRGLGEAFPEVLTKIDKERANEAQKSFGLRAGTVITGGGALGMAFKARGRKRQKQKLAQGLKRALPNLAQKIQPVPTTKLRPIIDDDYDFEV